ncbi:hypothetical protein F8M41_021203 [Gigaspora margarita]|uniref:Uncharacterized protein n=1 Tax=Gigaspora margarita TaxID=4874 RepID=A0A8H4ETR2_GIGMA|nr:hypothetical protein F8M41_021203 [Gigaspora margarita]
MDIMESDSVFGTFNKSIMDVTEFDSVFGTFKIADSIMDVMELVHVFVTSNNTMDVMESDRVFGTFNNSTTDIMESVQRFCYF